MTAVRLLLSLITLTISACFAKSEVKGFVADATTGKYLNGAVCNLYDVSGKRKSWMITGKTGEFKFDSENSDSIRITLLGFNSSSIAVKDLTAQESHIIFLEPIAVDLNEVIVKAKPITEKGDTLVYNVNSFKSQSDRTLSDVLKKMPGIEVNSSGGIKYQNKNINNFYIEGRDMLGARYGVATNNLDINAIASVEVIQHNQHIKAISDVKPSNQPAVNIKIKNGFLVKPFGVISASGGYPELYGGKFTLTMITRKIQALVYLNGGNTGYNWLSDLNEQQGMSESQRANEPQYLSIASPIIPPVSRSRYIFDRGYAATANLLIPTSEFSDIRINADYGCSRASTSSISNNIYSVSPDASISINESNSNINYIRRMRFKGTYELNSREKYLKNAFTYFHDHSKIKSTIKNNDRSIDGLGLFNPWYIKNVFSTYIKNPSGNVIKLSSVIRGGNVTEMLDNNFTANLDAVSSTSINELFCRKFFITDNSITTGFPFLKEWIDLTTGASYTHNTFSDSIKWNVSPAIIPSHAKASIGKLTLYATPEIRIRLSNKFTTYIKIPLNFYNIKSDAFDDNKRYNRFFVSSDINFLFNPFSSLYTRAGYSHKFKLSNERSLIESPYLTSYRSIYFPSGNVYHTISDNINFEADFRDIATLTYTSLTINYSRQKSNYTSTSEYTDNWSYFSDTEDNSTAKSLNIKINFSKSFEGSKTRFAVTPMFFRYSTQLLQNDMRLNTILNNYNLSLRIENRSLRSLNLTYDIQGRVSNSRSAGFKSTNTYGFAQNLNIYIYPLRNISIKINPSHSIIQTGNDSFKNFLFLDISASYRYKKWELELNGEDLLNNHDYSIESKGATTTSYMSIPLRGRCAYATLKRTF